MNKYDLCLFLLPTLLITSLTAFADDSETKLETKPYGWILPKYGMATAGLKTFTTQTEVAPTAVASQLKPTTLNGAVYDPSVNSYGRANWQIGQSRFGINFKGGSQVTGKLEVDFFNNDDAEPEYSLLAPRLRIASVNYQISDNANIWAGQDWDIFNGGVGPFTYNPVGNYFQAGNAGFLRQQVAYRMGYSTGVNFSVALGLPSKNDNAVDGVPTTDGPSQLSAIPTVAINLSTRDSAEEVTGLSAIAGRVVFAGGTVGSDSHTAYGVSVFSAKNFGPSFKVRAKVYYGQNLYNINALTLGSGAGTMAKANAYDFREFGGFVSTWTGITEQLGLLLTAGMASSPSTSTMGPLLTATSSIMTSNLKASVGLDYVIVKNLKTFAELSYFSSSYYEGKAASTANTYSAEFLDLGLKFDLI